MGRMKELQIETHNLARDWEYLLARILGQADVGKAMVLKPDDAPSDREEWEMYQSTPDLAFTPHGADTKVAIEFKMFRWQSEWQRRVADAVSHVQTIIKASDFERGLVILSLDLPEEQLAPLQAFESPEVDIWGLAKLRSLTEGNEELAQALEDLASDTVLDGNVGSPGRMEPEKPTGARLAGKLRGTESGKRGWREFEIYCEQAIRLLFGRELSNLIAQQRTDDRLNRMDLIGRIKSDGGSFWSMIASDFATRYIVFDAKNCREPITQSEIQITEKYLFTKGLRAVAIVIARNGAAKGAFKAAEGELREHGKLILIITLEDLCVMLEGADAGDPPENLLFQRMDDMLMAMGR